MDNIALIRIDDRLIHGQVMTAWLGTIRARRIVVIDDVLAVDDFMRHIMQMAVPDEIIVDIVSVLGSVRLIESGEIKEKTIVLVKNLATIMKLFEHGIKFNPINIGGISASLGRKPFYKNIYASIEEVEIMRELIKKDIELYIQIVPEQSIVNVTKILNKKEE